MRPPSRSRHGSLFLSILGDRAGPPVQCCWEVSKHAASDMPESPIRRGSSVFLIAIVSKCITLNLSSQPTTSGSVHQIEDSPSILDLDDATHTDVPVVHSRKRKGAGVEDWRLGPGVHGSIGPSLGGTPLTWLASTRSEQKNTSSISISPHFVLPPTDSMVDHSLILSSMIETRFSVNFFF